ncbi:MAG: tetratricopeptide repeat protein [Burkholderiales bacterium]
MSGRAIRRLGWALAATAVFGLAAAQDPVNLDDLKSRASAGDKAATRRLADLYYAGRDGVEQDFREAARWYEKLAKLGDARAQTSLGLMYARGYGVEKDLRKAHRYWSFAAAQNDPGAQFNLGLSYSLGQGVAQDFERAAGWYRKAAIRGHVQAQHNLGMLYHRGRGVDRDPLRAYFWVKVAALQGDAIARNNVTMLAAELTPEQIREADTEAETWKAKARNLAR